MLAHFGLHKNLMRKKYTEKGLMPLCKHLSVQTDKIYERWLSIKRIEYFQKQFYHFLHFLTKLIQKKTLCHVQTFKLANIQDLDEMAFCKDDVIYSEESVFFISSLRNRVQLLEKEFAPIVADSYV